MLQREEYLIRDLLDAGLIKESDVEKAAVRAKSEHISIDRALVDAGAVATRDVAIARALLYESSYVDISCYEIDLRLASLLPKSLAEKHTAFPLFQLNGAVTVGMVDPMDFKAVDQIRGRLGNDMAPVLCEAQALKKLISRAYTIVDSGRQATVDDESATDLVSGDEPIVAAVQDLIVGAIERGASDIHLNADQAKLHLRYRIDGVLRPQQGPPLAAHEAIVRRIKVLANLDLTQERKPLDGKFQFSHDGNKFDLRCSTIPTICGESVVIRILRPDSTFNTFSELGMPPEVQQPLEAALDRPHGLILVTGPTGSGKTSTLYTALQQLNSPERNIMTVEDPVEIRLPLVRQSQVNHATGLDFASALRAMLRQDPDVILVGEIRDSETAQIAVQASLTGHLVLSTLHTNGAVGAVDRLRDLGVPGYAVSGSLLCVVAQRLVRRLCEHCATPHTPTPDEIAAFSLHAEAKVLFKRASGCQQCQGIGYRGRLGVYEILSISAAIQRAIHEEEGPTTLRRIAQGNGMRLMLDDGLDKARQGLTSLEELRRVQTITEEESSATASDAPAVRMSA